MDTSVDRRHTRNKAPRALSLLLKLVEPAGPKPSKSGVTLRSQPIVRIAMASLMLGDLRLMIRPVLNCCMAASDCLPMESMRGESG